MVPFNRQLSMVSGCTSTNVRKVDSSDHKIKSVCIERNPEVLVADMVHVLESGFHRHGIKTTTYQGQPLPGCEYTLWYTAYRGWDFVPFLKSAELRLRRNGVDIASASYNHKGGFALNKWEGTDTKLDPVIDELLADFNLQCPGSIPLPLRYSGSQAQGSVSQTRAVNAARFGKSGRGRAGECLNLLLL